MADLMLHSLKEYEEIIFSLLDRTRPSSVLEIGTDSGPFTDRLIKYCGEKKVELVTVEPSPSQALAAQAIDSEAYNLYQGLGLIYLLAPGCRAEFTLIDGDHNYFSVYNELKLLDRAWSERGAEGVVLVHHVGWPCARRDSYYEPDALPSEVVHPHSFDLGASLDVAALGKGGLRGGGSFAMALNEGGARNGVLTAVEDFLKDQPRYAVRTIDSVFGLAAITVRGTESERHVNEVFGPYDNELVRRLERNRLELFLKVVELQDALNAQSAAPPPR